MHTSLKQLKEILNEAGESLSHEDMMHSLALDLFHELMARKDNETGGNADPEEVANIVCFNYDGVDKDELISDYYDEIEDLGSEEEDEYYDEEDDEFEEEDEYYDEDDEDDDLEEGFISSAGFDYSEGFSDMFLDYEKAADAFMRYLEQEKRNNNGRLSKTLEFYAQQFDHRVHGKYNPRKLVKILQRKFGIYR